jgi:hypothetical protein
MSKFRDTSSPQHHGKSCPRKGISAIMEKGGVKVQFLAILGVKMQFSLYSVIKIRDHRMHRMPT